MNSYRCSLLFFALSACTFAQNWEVVSSSDDQPPISARERLRWVADGTVSPRALIGESLVAGWSTMQNSPHEYGSNLGGFGQRMGIAVATGAMSDTIEAGLGAAWGEDPRYVRQPGVGMPGRLRSVVLQTFMARNANQQFVPAYARFIAIPASNVLSNNFRVDREATAGDTMVRIGLGFVGRMSGNAFNEFWPDIRRKFSHDKSGGR